MTIFKILLLSYGVADSIYFYLSSSTLFFSSSYRAASAANYFLDFFFSLGIDSFYLYNLLNPIQPILNSPILHLVHCQYFLKLRDVLDIYLNALQYETNHLQGNLYSLRVIQDSHLIGVPNPNTIRIGDQIDITKLNN